MSFIFEELDYQDTPLGAISLRRRAEPRLNGEILYEVKLRDEFLMSSLFTEAEIQLSRYGLAALDKPELDVVVGGLGLGYTAVAALEDERVTRLQVIDVMEAVIRWHKEGMVPLGHTVSKDPRTTLTLADFFAEATADQPGFNGPDGIRQVDAVLLDIDHSPSHWLNEGNSTFYTEESLQSLSDKLIPGGVFGIWSNELPDDQFTALLEKVFTSVEAHTVPFPNPYTGGESYNSVYVAKKQG